MEDSTVLQSAVRLPTPPLERASIPLKRKGSFSNSPPPPATRPKRVFRDVDPERGAERERQYEDRLRQEPEEKAKPLTDAEKQEKAKEEYQRLLKMRSGGTYVPPARLRALQAQVTDKSSKEYQRMAWEALKKSINGLINKVNVSNIKHIVPELFAENLVRGRGLFCRSMMKAQAASLPFTPIYAAMAAIVNTKLPQVGELLMNRLVVQFRKAFKRNDKTVCLSSTTFIAHLCNQQVIHELVAAHMLQLLLSNPTDDSVEIAVGLTREVGQQLEEMSGPIAMLVFDQFRNILHEADIDKRTQYMIEVLFQVRKDRFKDNPAVREELDLVEEEDQITHKPPAIDDPDIDVEDGLNIFKYDSDYEEHEEAYRKLKAEILGEGSDESGSDASSDASDEASEDEAEREMEIKDQSNTNLTNLRRTIYLTINSSADFEECCHKLMKLNIPAGLESELPSMIIETCSQRPTYEKFYGLIGERFARLNRLWTNLFEESFIRYYDTIHRYETNRLRNIARFFGHLISADAIGWHVFSVIHLNEEETTSSSRIFIKILFQDLAEAMGMAKLQTRLKDETLQPSFTGLFPRDDPRNIRFSINYFTSIGMGAVTEDLREYLKNMPKPAVPALPAATSNDRSDSESVSSYSSGYDSGSRSRSRSSRGSRSRSRSESRSYSDSRASSRSRTPPERGRSTRQRRPSYTPSQSGSKSRSRSRSISNSRTLPRRQQAKRRAESDYSRSPSKTPPRSRRTAERRQSSASAASGSRSRSPTRSPEPRKSKPQHSAHDRVERNRGRDNTGIEKEPERQGGRRRRRGSSSRSSSSSGERQERGRRTREDRRRRKSRSRSASIDRSRGRDRGKGSDWRSERNGNGKTDGRRERERSLSPYSRRAAMSRR